MKNLKLTLLSLGLSVFIFSCNKSKSNNSPSDAMSAQISGNAFSAQGDNVNGLIATNPADNTKTELTVTGESGTKVLTIAVFDYKSTAGTFDFTTGAALGGYESTSGSGDDPIVSGSVVITTVTDHLIEGTFSGTTQGGTSITSGSFTLNK